LSNIPDGSVLPVHPPLKDSSCRRIYGKQIAQTVSAQLETVDLHRPKGGFIVAGPFLSVPIRAHPWFKIRISPGHDAERLDESLVIEEGFNHGWARMGTDKTS
jgi:hypothetical protein